MAAFEEERVIRSASLGWRQHRKPCAAAGLELGERVPYEQGIELFPSKITDTILLAHEFQQWCSLCESGHANSIRKAVPPEPATSAQNHRVFAALRQFGDQPAFSGILFEELKK